MGGRRLSLSSSTLMLLSNSPSPSPASRHFNASDGETALSLSPSSEHMGDMELLHDMELSGDDLLINAALPLTAGGDSQAVLETQQGSKKNVPADAGASDPEFEVQGSQSLIAPLLFACPYCSQTFTNQWDKVCHLRLDHSFDSQG